MLHCCNLFLIASSTSLAQLQNEDSSHNKTVIYRSCILQFITSIATFVVVSRITERNIKTVQFYFSKQKITTTKNRTIYIFHLQLTS